MKQLEKNAKPSQIKLYEQVYKIESENQKQARAVLNTADKVYGWVCAEE
jgi:citrate lyase beta subunit